MCTYSNIAESVTAQLDECELTSGWVMIASGEWLAPS